MVVTNEMALRATKSFIRNNGITDDDLIQELYLAVCEMVDRNYSNPGSSIHSKLANVSKRYYKEKLKTMRKRGYDLEDYEETMEDTCFQFELDKKEDEEYEKYLLALAMQTLDAREQFVIKESFGFNGPAKNATQLGKEMGLSGTRVIQIKNKALCKCKQRIASLKRKERKGIAI